MNNQAIDNLLKTIDGSFKDRDQSDALAAVYWLISSLKSDRTLKEKEMLLQTATEYFQHHKNNILN